MAVEKKLKAHYKQIIDIKQLEIEKLNKELAKQLDFANGSIEQTLSADPKPQVPHHSTSQVKVVRVNNFVSGKDSSASSKSNSRANASSHSPSSLAGASKDGSTSIGSKLRKGLKVVNQMDKSPYINNCFDKSAVNQTSASSNNSESASSSVKANRKGAASAEISESSLIVLKKSTKNAVEGAVQTVNGI